MKTAVITFFGVFTLSSALGQTASTVVPFGRPANPSVRQADPTEIVTETEPALLKKTGLPCTTASPGDAPSVTDPALTKKVVVKMPQPSEIILETDPAYLKKDQEKEKKK